MATKTQKKVKPFFTPPTTIHYAQGLYTLKSLKKDGSDPFYGCTIALPKDHKWWKTLEKRLNAALEAKFDEIPRKIKHWPILDGDEEEDTHMHGCNFIRVRRSEDEGKPQIVNEDVDPITDMSEVYSGMQGRLSIRVGAWEHSEGGVVQARGVSIYLNNVMKTDEGEPIGRVTTKAVDDFAEFMDEGDDEDDEYDEDEDFDEDEI